MVSQKRCRSLFAKYLHVLHRTWVTETASWHLLQDFIGIFVWISVIEKQEKISLWTDIVGYEQKTAKEKDKLIDWVR